MSSITETHALDPVFGWKSHPEPHSREERRDVANPPEAVTLPVVAADGTDPSTEATVSDQVASAIFDAALTDERDRHAMTVEDAMDAYHSSE